MRMLMIPALLALVAGCSGAPKEATQREQIGQSWKYETADTQGNQAAVAYIGSTNSVQTMTAPDTFSVLLVQPMANGEKEVTVKLVGAPFTCDMSNCTVTARADDGKTLTWQGRLTENRDGIAIMPSQNAYEAIAKARVVKVDLKVGPDDKTFPFAFDVAGLALKS